MADLEQPTGSHEPVAEQRDLNRAVKLGRGRKAGVGVLLAVSTILTIVACLGVWINRQVMQKEGWVTTSSQLLRNPAVQKTLAEFLSDQVTQSGAVQPLVEQVLPPRLDPLAPAVVSGLGELTDRAALRALRSERFQRLWVEANGEAQEQLIVVLNQGGDQRAVTLNLRPMLLQLANRVGAGARAEQLIAAQGGQVTVIEADEIATLRQAAKFLRAVTWVALILALLGFAGAVYLARGRRAGALIASGACIASAGLIVLFLRRLLGEQVVAASTGAEGPLEAALATWTIGSSLLQQAATSLVYIGAVVLIAGALGTQARLARRVRDWAAPAVTQEPALAYGAATLLVLLVLVWNPIPATHTWLGALLVLAGVLGGVAALRAQITREQAAA